MLFNVAYAAAAGARRPATMVLPTIDNPKFGIDVDQRSFFRSDINNTTAAIDGANIARINDCFGVAPIWFEHDDVAAQPIIKAAALGSRAALRFVQGGPVKWMYAAGGATPATQFQSRTFTVAICYRRATATGYAGLFTAGNGNGGNNGGGFDNLLLEGNPAPQGYMKLVRAGGADVAIARLANASYADNQVTKVVVRGDPTNGLEIRSRSASGNFAGTSPMPASADLYPWDWSLLGAELGYSGLSLPINPFDGDLFELRFWGARADDTNTNLLQSYLDAKFGS